MRNFLLLFLLISLSNALFANLNPGDIAFVQYNADGTDDFAFVALVDIPANEEIKFTDNGWKADDTFKTNEGIVTWTAPAGGLSAGDVVTITMSPSTTVGSVTKSGIFNFLATGDQLIAYQGTNSMIYALNNEGNGVWQTDSPNTSESKLPMGLTNGTDATAANEIDNLKYNGIVTTGTKEEILAAINNKDNWIGSDTYHQTYDGAAFVLPIELVAFDAFAKNNHVTLTWETATETNNDYFHVERSTNGQRFEVIGKVIGAGNSTTTQRYTFIDPTPAHGTNYYRLSQTDFDGKSETFDVVSVDFHKAGITTIHPTQVRDIMNLSIEPKETVGRVIIFNLMGQKVFDAPIDAGASRMEIDATTFAPGPYFARVSNGHLVETVRFIKG
ncbi:MAG TPA: T9SS type A sorting domain-containing protein [Saprospiraceae bacterium]|nr:T9SS type A sorting domain-containing protein [Saprospiraceae bacterium]